MKVPKGSRLEELILEADKKHVKKGGKVVRQLTKSVLEKQFQFMWNALQGAPLEREWRVSPKRRFRFDFAIPKIKVAIEIEGGTWVNRRVKKKSGEEVTVQGGAHNSGTGYIKDVKKYNISQYKGWSLFRFTGEMINTAEIEPLIKWVDKQLKRYGKSN